MADRAHTAGRVVRPPRFADEIDAAIQRVRSRTRSDAPPGAGSTYEHELTPEEAIALFLGRQKAYSASIEHGIAKLHLILAGEEMDATSLGVEPWPELAERLAGYRFPRSKRVMDIVGALLCLILLAPLFLAIAIAIKVDSPGPVVFRSQRVGQGGRRILVLIFRTMIEGAAARDLYIQSQENTGLFKIRDDPRITRLGRWLRRLSLDELPQLVNVLRGEMSLVGPRPLTAVEVLDLEGSKRLLLRPGLTGPWQLRGMDTARWHSDEMVRLDYLYATTWSLWSDLKLLAETVPAVIARRPY